MAPSLWQLLIVLAIVIMVFGTKRLRSMGGDLGSAIRGFKDSMRGGEKDAEDHVEQLSTEDSESTKPAGNSEGKAGSEASGERNKP